MHLSSHPNGAPRSPRAHRGNSEAYAPEKGIPLQRFPVYLSPSTYGVALTFVEPVGARKKIACTPLATQTGPCRVRSLLLRGAPFGWLEGCMQFFFEPPPAPRRSEPPHKSIGTDKPEIVGAEFLFRAHTPRNCPYMAPRGPVWELWVARGVQAIFFRAPTGSIEVRATP